MKFWWTFLGVCVFIVGLLGLAAVQFAAPARGQCGRGGCSAPAQVAPPIFAPVLLKDGWHEVHPGEVALYRAGVHVGGWSVAGQYYLPLAADRWGTPGPSPVPVPPEYVRAPGPSPPVAGTPADPLNFGLDRDKLAGEGYSISGKKCSKAAAYQIIGDKSLIDDSRKLRLTVIGTAGECARVLGDLTTNPALKELTRDVLTREYRPDHWQVDGPFAAGSPAIYFQQPRGEVLLRLAAYPGPALFAAQLRKSWPDYDPKKDPDGKPPVAPHPPDNPNPGPPALDLAQVHPLVWVALVVATGLGIQFYRSKPS